ncbi:MAG: NAD(P)H:quinone oxidoreductase [Pseudomonadota bacterium]|nr:NAD(P)H:quinone oxidoreductase [Pseudomonadota bacterium]
MKEILVLYYSKHGSTEALAREICFGIDSVKGISSKIRTVPPISALHETIGTDIPGSGPPYVDKQDLSDCHGLVLGSPCRFGNMAAELKYFLDSTSNEWLNNTLAGKPAGVFTSSKSQHGGQESTLLTMAIPLLHHGMLITGIPYSEKVLSTTSSGGTPYGPSHVSSNKSNDALTNEEMIIARSLGSRIAKIAIQLNSSHS